VANGFFVADSGAVQMERILAPVSRLQNALQREVDCFLKGETNGTDPSH
jgi:hypothetical protein